MAYPVGVDAFVLAERRYIRGDTTLDRQRDAPRLGPSILRRMNWEMPDSLDPAVIVAPRPPTEGQDEF